MACNTVTAPEISMFAAASQVARHMAHASLLQPYFLLAGPRFAARRALLILIVTSCAATEFIRTVRYCQLSDDLLEVTGQDLLEPV